MTSSTDGPSSSGDSPGSGFAASGTGLAPGTASATAQQASAAAITAIQMTVLPAMRPKRIMWLTPMLCPLDRTPTSGDPIT